jgi:hypothetical protein
MDQGVTLLCDEVIELLSSGVVISVATRDPALVPECVPAMGTRVHRDRRALTLFLPRAVIGATLVNIADNGRVAINLTRPTDEKSIQLKGRATAVREPTDADRTAQELYRGALTEQLAVVGMPRAMTRRLTWWPSVAIEVQLEDVFVQTPGPGAGRRMTG